MMTRARSLVLGALVGIVGAALLAAVPTVLDWTANPGGIFYTEAGTHWGRVFETWFSWFWPLAALVAPASVFLQWWTTSKRAASGS